MGAGGQHRDLMRRTPPDIDQRVAIVRSSDEGIKMRSSSADRSCRRPSSPASDGVCGDATSGQPFSGLGFRVLTVFQLRVYDGFVSWV